MKRNRVFALLLTLALLLSAAGCGGGSSGMTAGGASSAGGAAETEEWDNGLTTAPMEPTAGESEDKSGGSVYRNTGAKLIRRAELSIQTTEFDKAAQALDKLVSGIGGYFESASVYGGSYRDAYASRSGEYVVRVPAEKYDEFLSSAGELGYVTSSSESSEDVGEDYYDTEARLKTQRTKQERLLALLEKAETMEDIIALEGALSDVEYQIEQLSSTLNRYDALIGFATIRVYLNEVARITEEVGETDSLGTRMAAGFAASLRGLVQGGQDLLVWLSYHIFFLVIVGAIAALSIAVALRVRKKRRKEPEKPKE